MAGKQAMKVLFGGPWNDLSDGIAVLVGMLGEQAGEAALQGVGSLGALELNVEGPRETRPAQQCSARGVLRFQSFSCSFYESHKPKFS